MKLDHWCYFNLPSHARQMIDAFASPDTEASVVKDIPIGALPQAKPVMRMIEKLTGRRMRVIYRGPRYDHGRSWCRKADALRFAIYFR